jgi:hypothetical protein
MSTPPRKRIVIPRNRQSVTGEADPGGRYTPAFPDSIGYSSQGGGSVPADLVWRSSPKQRQEELTEANLQSRRLTSQATLMARLAEGKRPAALPAGDKPAPTQG